MPVTLLVADDVRRDRDEIASFLRANRYDVITAESSVQALKHLQDPVDLVIADQELSLRSGIDLLQRWQQRRPATPFIMVARQQNVDLAVQAMKRGARDFLSKPFSPEQLLESIERNLSPAPGLAQFAGRGGFEKLIGHSQAMFDVFECVEQAARVDSTVVIIGESGTGKELIAEAIHQHSPRRQGPFIVTNMAAVPDHLIESELFGHVRGAFTGAEKGRVGRFEAAHGGTIFIDEIGELKMPLQAKLLRVLESHEITPVGSNESRHVDVRVVAATNRKLERMIADGEFREDLYYRLKVVTVELPPLRDRREDIPMLIKYFLVKFSSEYKLPLRTADECLLEFLVNYDWPGNVRQLRNCIESMVVLGQSEELTLDDLPLAVRRPQRDYSGRLQIPFGMKLESLKRIAIEQALTRCGGHRLRTAETLEISVRTLHRHLKRWNIS